MSNGFIYVVDAHFIDKIEKKKKKKSEPKCLCVISKLSYNLLINHRSVT